MRVSGTFAATGNSAAITVRGGRRVDISLDFGEGTVVLQRSVDEGTTWLPVSTEEGTALSWTADVATTWLAGTPAKFRLNCSAHTSDIDYVLEAGNKD